MNAATLLHRLRHPSWWRRSKGFGVHSPFAYSLIKFTLSESEEYCRYAELRELSKERFEETALILRLMSRFAPDRVAIIGDDKTLKKAVKIADSRCTVVSSPPAPLVVVDNAEMFEPDSLSSECVVLFCDLRNPAAREKWERLTSEMKRGMTFTDDRRGLICRFATLPRQEFKTIF